VALASGAAGASFASSAGLLFASIGAAASALGGELSVALSVDFLVSRFYIHIFQFIRYLKLGQVVRLFRSEERHLLVLLSSLPSLEFLFWRKITIV